VDHVGTLKRNASASVLEGSRLGVCIVGGGFTGVAAAIALLDALDRPFRLSIVEPKSELGRGVAFGGHHPLHLLNVRARDLSVSASQPGDFLNWAFSQLDQGEQQAGLHEGLAHAFLPRQLFGEYVRERFFAAASRRRDVALQIVDAEAIACTCENGAYRVQCAGKEAIEADVVILATAYGLKGSSPSAALSPFAPLPTGRLVAAQSIVLIGSGLTVVDALLSARRNGFRGLATIVSPRGQLPQPHAPKGVGAHEIGMPPTKRVSLLAQRVRIACETSEAHGIPWQAVINGLRPLLQELWQGLPVEEQSRFLRHLRPFWDSHRHRMPPEIHAQLQSELRAGKARLLRGRVRSVRRQQDRFSLLVSRAGLEKVMETDLAFDCSGHRPDLASPLIRDLIEKKLVRSDPHGLGLIVEGNGQVLSENSQPCPGLFAVGPLCQGSLWEITAVPEIVRQVARTAQSIASAQRSQAMAAEKFGRI
jgi:uncharacterized NAD(P)/FAD-binding protein YdhS